MNREQLQPNLLHAMRQRPIAYAGGMLVGAALLTACGKGNDTAAAHCEGMYFQDEMLMPVIAGDFAQPGDHIVTELKQTLGNTGTFPNQNFSGKVEGLGIPVSSKVPTSGTMELTVIDYGQSGSDEAPHSITCTSTAVPAIPSK